MPAETTIPAIGTNHLSALTKSIVRISSDIVLTSILLYTIHESGKTEDGEVVLQLIR
jgi:hypothetical protein